MLLLHRLPIVQQYQQQQKWLHQLKQRHADGLENAPWPDLISSMVVDMPVNLVRVAAGPEILSHIGEKAVLKAHSRWVNARTRNIVGVLRAKEKTDLALVIPVTYDAASVLPDHADGPVQALQTSLQLQLLKGLLPHRDALRRDVIFIALTGVSQQLHGASRLLSTIGTYGKTEAMGVRIQGEIAENENRVRLLKEILSLFDDPAFASDPAATDAKIKALAPDIEIIAPWRMSAAFSRTVPEPSCARLSSTRRKRSSRPKSPSSATPTTSHPRNTMPSAARRNATTT